jgi:2-dehydro-3-deoxyphosphooctonate aldolase (KDO 8-P synthase)
MAKNKTVKIGKIEIGNNKPFVLIAGPCVIENRRATIDIARKIKNMTGKLRIPFIFKASYDKANRTSANSFRGIGIEEGLAVLAEIKETLNVPILSDVHSEEEIEFASVVLDVLQIPAFLCRQTDLLIAAGETGKAVNIKKGQFLAPEDMAQAAAKVESTGNKSILLTERGTTFGYHNLVSDFRSLDIMRRITGYPVVFDATHSVQQPGGKGHASGGCREYVPLLGRCAAAAGVDAVFIETHPNPDKALSDGPNMLPLNKLEKFLSEIKAVDNLVKSKGMLE